VSILEDRYVCKVAQEFHVLLAQPIFIFLIKVLGALFFCAENLAKD